MKIEVLHSLVSQATVLLLFWNKNGCVGDYQPVDFATCEFAIYILGPLSPSQRFTEKNA